jgi:hypothetical protein
MERIMGKLSTKYEVYLETVFKNNEVIHKNNGIDNYNPNFKYGTIAGIKNQYESGSSKISYIQYTDPKDLNCDLPGPDSLSIPFTINHLD